MPYICVSEQVQPQLSIVIFATGDKAIGHMEGETRVTGVTGVTTGTEESGIETIIIEIETIMETDTEVIEIRTDMDRDDMMIMTEVRDRQIGYIMLG